MSTSFTIEEKILCAMLVIKSDLTKNETQQEYDRIAEYKKLRNTSSVTMKCRNYVAMISHIIPSLPLNPHIPPLTGSTTGKSTRMTDAEIVIPLITNTYINKKL